jgi:8-oxo-dGTP diphosphatase
MKSRVVVAAIVEKDSQILLGRKPPGIGPYPDTWHLPGGGARLEEETAEQALVREVTEETGIRIGKPKRISFNEDFEPDMKGEMTHYLFLVYLAPYLSGECKPGDDIRMLKWFAKGELNNLSLARPSIVLFKDMGWL